MTLGQGLAVAGVWGSVALMTFAARGLLMAVWVTAMIAGEVKR